MPALVEVTALYEGDADAIFRSALRFNEMTEAMAGLATYEGLPDGPAEAGATYTVDVTFWGAVKMTGYVMHVESIDLDARVLQSREHGAGVRRWDHTLSVTREGDKARWVDRIVIDAGWRTFFNARFGAYMYRRRHRHRNALEIASRITKA